MQSLNFWPLRPRQQGETKADPLFQRAIVPPRGRSLTTIKVPNSREVRRVASRRLRRIELASSRRQRPWRLFALVFVGLSATYGLWSGGQVQKLYEQAENGVGAMAVAAGLGAQRIVLEGQQHASDAEIAGALGANSNTILLGFDTAAAKERLEQVPWVKHAQVMRLLPSTLKVVIEERTPFAIWQNKGKTYVVDADGAVLAPAIPDAYPSLPIVVGEGAAKNASELLATLAMFSNLEDQMLAAIRVGDRRWNLKLLSGLDVMLPDDNIGQALTALTDLDDRRGILNRDIASVDLRLADRVTVRLHETPRSPAGGPPGQGSELPTASTIAAPPKGST
ncbi:cell division protein FtsQ [Methyloligella halotolerans]|uniref:Cell division protein FtsQ n=1 Tax=Methyloligella halotolerans TaxID=1177755 RepID=A0A1E2S3N4_9HYPH|nr:cell division protein FtsQ/DivIB [Methyloligella halotolerans]ODA69012.1 cell division protein FtsQ [Methyloligella halotolerans]